MPSRHGPPPVTPRRSSSASTTRPRRPGAAAEAAAEVEAAAEAEAEAVEADVGDVVVSTEQAASPKGQPLPVFITTTGEVFV